MKKIILSFIIFISLTNNSVVADNFFHLFSERVEGSGQLETIEYQLESFNKISSTGSFDIIVRSGEQQKILITIDDNLTELIETKVDNNTLTITTKGSFCSQSTCKFVISVPELEMVSLFGSGDVEVINLDANSFAYLLSGSGDLKAFGKVKELELNIAGSGEIDTRELIAEDAIVHISGSGHIKVYANEYLNGHINGSGNIYYYGNPEYISSHISGSGSIKKK